MRMTTEEIAALDEKRKKKQGFRSSAKWNGDFYSIKTYSGRGSLIADPEGVEHLLAPKASEKELGEAIVDALSYSRYFSDEEASQYFPREPTEKRYQAWIEKLMLFYKYKTKGALFRKMLHVAIKHVDNMLTFTPTHHEGTRALWSWDFVKESDYVTLPATASPEEIGAALKLAFSRCTGAGPT